MRGLPVGAFLLVLAAAGVAAGAGTGAQVDGPAVEAGLSTGDTLDGSAEEVTLSNGSSATVNVVVEGAADGVGSADLSLSVDDPEVVRITEVRLGGNGTVTDTSVAENGTSATASAIGLERPGETATVLEVDMVATGSGTASMNLSVDSIGDSEGQSYDVTVTDGTAAIAVGGAKGGEESDGDGNSDLPAGLLAVVAVLVAISAGGFLLYRREN